MMNEHLFVKINGLKICYKMQGEGKPVFLIHGLGVKKEFWIAQIGALSSKFKVIYFDLKGAGKSDRPSEPYTMETYIDEIRGLLNFLDITKAHFIGHSFGGMVLINFCLQYPDYVDKLVLMATLPNWPKDPGGLESWKKNQIELYEAALKNPVETFYTKMKLRLTRGFLKLMQEDPKKKFHDIFSAEDLIQMGKIDPMKPRDIINMSNVMGTHDTLDRLHEIKKETLIMAGEKDKLTPKAISFQIKERIPNSIIKLFEGSHYFPLENAPEVNQTIIEFLEK
ncbi:MAG: alpha/beta fold hydrolase [Candidatus Hermodarchaeota archaeon]